jgi:hypothetical protein
MSLPSFQAAREPKEKHVCSEETIAYNPYTTQILLCKKCLLDTKENTTP